jgi:glycosyltransferase involved in cell wall biosynthesis
VAARASEVEATIAVPVKNRREQMLRCLDALLAQDHPSYEVLVLDNQSTDGTAEACLAHAATSSVPVRVEVVPGSLGHVRNRGGELARGTFVAFTDSDCAPAPSWLSAGTRALRADPRLGVICGRTEPDEPIDRPWPHTTEITEFTKRFEACNVIYRREALVASDGFEEQLAFMWEDAAAGYAVLRQGWRAAFVEDAVVRHDVTYPGFRFHVTRARMHANAPGLLRRYPELRRELFWGRIFMRSRNARFVAFLAGMALAPWWRPALLLALPYAWLRAPRRLALGHLWHHGVEGFLYDGAIFVGLVQGSVIHRRLLL